MKHKLQSGIVLGLALFAMFFGAGNLIFPTSVGLNAGDQWLSAMLGFLTTGVGLPLLGVFAVIKIGGSLKDFAKKLGGFFSVLYGMTIITSLALVAVSRTAATTFEMSIQPILPGASPIISSIIFFTITLLLAFNPSGIIDRIGKILTPILLVMLSIIIFKGVTEPIGTPVVNGNTGLFSTGFFGGYQTMDALGSVMLGGIIMTALLEKGFKNRKDQTQVAKIAIVIAGLGLAVVYGGLLYLGSTSSGILSSELSRTSLTVSIVQLILGDVGKIVLGICVAFACLTTSVGLTATVGDFYEELTKGKIKYRQIVIITSILCAVIANIGVEAIVRIATPLLVAIYPITIVLIALNLLSHFIQSKAAYVGAVLGAFIISSFDGLAAAGLVVKPVMQLIQVLPFAEQGFAWVLPSMIGLIAGLVIDRIDTNNYNMKKPRRAIGI